LKIQEFIDHSYVNHSDLFSLLVLLVKESFNLG